MELAETRATQGECKNATGHNLQGEQFTRAHRRAHWDSIVMSARVHVSRAQNTIAEAGPGRGGPMGTGWT